MGMMVEDSWILHETGRTVKNGISFVMVGPKYSWSSIHREYISSSSHDIKG